MFYVERSSGGGNWVMMMASPHQIGVYDLQGPPETDRFNFPPSRAPNHKTAFAGKPGWKARVRFRDTLVEEFEWREIPENPHDKDSRTVWGWDRTFLNTSAMSESMGAGQMSFL